MIKNTEFKKLKFYKEMIELSERKNFFDKYSIIKAFSHNITRGKSFLLEQLRYNDEDCLQSLFEEIEDIEIIGDDSFYLKNSNNNILLKFAVLEDGSFLFIGSIRPLSYGRGKIC